MAKSISRIEQPAPLVTTLGETRHFEEGLPPAPPSQIPAYLKDTYWWAYINPNAVNFFERQWVINLILWGNFVRLRDMALDELGSVIRGNTLQIACVYGDFSSKLAQRITEGGSLDIVDVVQVQLDNLRNKLFPTAPVRMMQLDSSSLVFKDESYDQVVLFFLLHEMPAPVRERTLAEAVRVLKKGGKMVIVDFHKPVAYHPLRYLYPIIYKLLEPFAMDTWNQKVEDWLPEGFSPASIVKETMFGRLYQKLVIIK